MVSKVGASYAPGRLGIAVGKSNYSKVSSHEYDFDDFDTAEHLSLAPALAAWFQPISQGFETTLT